MTSPEPTKVTRYRLVGDPQQAEHTYARFGEFAHQHDGETPHAHDGGGQFHHHYPGIPPGWEPAFLEG
jgi:hypothetical protein